MREDDALAKEVRFLGGEFKGRSFGKPGRLIRDDSPVPPDRVHGLVPPTLHLFFQRLNDRESR